MSIPSKLQAVLDERRVPYEVIPHDYAATAQRAAQIEHVPGRQHTKVVMVNAEGKLIMTVCAASDKVDLPQLERIVGKPVRLASEPEFKGMFPDCETGAMPPFGELYDVPVYVDKALTENREIVFEAGTHTEAVRMGYKDYESIVHPTVAEFARPTMV